MGIHKHFLLIGSQGDTKSIPTDSKKSMKIARKCTKMQCAQSDRDLLILVMSGARNLIVNQNIWSQDVKVSVAKFHDTESSFVSIVYVDIKIRYQHDLYDLLLKLLKWTNIKSTYGAIKFFLLVRLYRWQTCPTPLLGNGLYIGLSENSVPHCTQWFCWSLSLLNGYFIGNIPHFQTNPYIYINDNCLSQLSLKKDCHLGYPPIVSHCQDKATDWGQLPLGAGVTWSSRNLTIEVSQSRRFFRPSDISKY